MNNSIVSTGFGLLGSAVAYCFGGWDTSIITLLIFMLIDYVTGIVVATVFKKSTKTKSGGLKSEICFKGLIKKAMVLLFVIIANLLDRQIGTSYIRDAVCISFMVNELLSIIENAGLMGVPIPKPIQQAVDILTDKAEKTNG